jgi:hypothetical protein
MSLTPGEDTYISTEDAQTYFDGRLYSTTWTAASPEDKERALRAATSLIDQCDFKGNRTSSAQPLKWPRRYVADDEGRMLPSDLIPDPVKHAVCELAIYLLANDPAQQSASTVTHRVVGDLEVTYSAAQPDTLPPLVRRLLSPFLIVGANTAQLIP